MTLFRTRSQPVFDGDLPVDEPVTEILERAIQPAGWDATTVVFGGAAVVGLDPADVYRPAGGAGSYTPPAPPQQPPPRHSVNPCRCCRHDFDILGRGMTRGWPHLFEVRCTYPAAHCDTPIPCGRTHRDEQARTLRGLRTSAWAAGWHLDALGRWACPDCCQASPQFRTLYPVTLWDGDALEAARFGDVRAEFWHRARAEHDLFRDVRDAARHGRHAGSAR